MRNLTNKSVILVIESPDRSAVCKIQLNPYKSHPRDRLSSQYTSFKEVLVEDEPVRVHGLPVSTMKRERSVVVSTEAIKFVNDENECLLVPPEMIDSPPFRDRKNIFILDESRESVIVDENELVSYKRLIRIR